MIPKFIELHWHGEPALINVDSIAIIREREFHDVAGHSYEIDESYEEIQELIKNEAGRVDMKFPLTFVDLKNMIGEPVWSSKIKKWLLVEHVDDGYAKCKTVNDAYVYYNFSEKDLPEHPLYRVRAK